MDPARPGVSMRFIESARLAGVLLAPLRDDGEKSRHAADQPARERQEAGPREFPAGVERATGGSWTRSVVSASLRSSAPAEGEKGLRPFPYSWTATPPRRRSKALRLARRP